METVEAAARWIDSELLKRITGSLASFSNPRLQCHTVKIGTAARSTEPVLSGCYFMYNIDDFRFQSHHLLLELDAATNHLMMLVVAKEVSGNRWDEAAKRQKLAYEAWAALLYPSGTDPMPA